jgi:hypothetical protein
VSSTAIVLAGPDLATDQIGRWRILEMWRYAEDSDVSCRETEMVRLLWWLDRSALSRRKTWPRYPQSGEKAQQAFKTRLCRLPRRNCRGAFRHLAG